MTVIFLNRYFYPDHSATSQMLSDLAFALSERGEQITVITSRLRYDDPAETLPAGETARGVRIERVWTSRFGRFNLAGRAIDYATFYIAAAWRLAILVRRGDIVVAKTDPPMLGVITQPIARLRGAKTINWLQDVFPEVAQALGVGGRAVTAGFSVLRGLRNRSLRKSDMNVAIGDRMAEQLQASGVPRRNIRVIPNWADCDAVVPVSPNDNSLRRAWGLGEAVAVGYSGNLGRAHEIETFLDAIARLEREPRGDGTPIRWIFIGGGAQFAAMQGEAVRRSLTSVSFYPYQPRDMLSLSLSAADIHLVSLRPELEGLIVPSKFYGIAAAGRPAIFIGDEDGEIARLLRAEKCGLTVPQGDGASLAASITQLADDPAVRHSMGENARAAALERFSRSGAAQAWQTLLAELRAPR